MSIKKQFILTVLILTMIPFLIVPIFGYIYIKNATEGQLLSQNEQNLDRIIKDLNNVLEEMISASNAIVLNNDLVASLEAKDRRIQTIKEIELNLSKVNAAQLFSYNADIYIYDLDKEIYVTTASSDRILMDDHKKKWIEDTLKMKGFFNWKSLKYNSLDEKEEYPVLGMARNILDINGKTVGVLSIEMLEERKMSSILYNATEYPNTERYLINDEGKTILSYIQNKKQNPVYTSSWFEDYKINMNENQYLNMVFNGEKQIILNQRLNKTKWRILQITPHKEVFKTILNYRNFIILTNTVFLFIILTLTILSTNRLTKSIIKLRDAMKSVKKGRFINIEVEKSSKEIEDLTKEFNTMSSQLDYLFNENKRIYKEKQRTKLEALHIQIQPHFLFNTLNGIKWLCRSEGAKTAEKMLVSLGYILEYSLGKNREYNTLEEEIDCLKHYIKIQKMRYGETFEVDIEIEKSLNTMKVPTLFLQPLIENAIIHGLQDREEWGKISIKACRKQDYVLITVKDNGHGMDKDQINQLLSSNKKTSGIGLMNVRQRIQLYYENGSDLSINSTKRVGTEVLLKLVQAKEG